MPQQNEFYQGLTSEEARALQAKHGKNELTQEKRIGFFRQALRIAGEPMFLLLLCAAVIYFFLGEPRDGAVMLLFVLGVIGIDIVQTWKTDKTLRALRDLSAPRVTVLRDGAECTILSADLVPGDLMLLHEGVKIPADGVILRCHDLRVDESTLTGEPEGVWKTTNGESSDSRWRTDYAYAGTLVTQGTGAVRVERIGTSTEYGKIGRDTAAAPDTPTPLQKQIAKLVQLCAVIAASLFLLVSAITYLQLPGQAFSARLISSVLAGITLAMAMIPEEFPVILAVFLSMGAWRLSKRQALVRRLPSVETLGAVSVLCVDKTGTITMNRMRVQEHWAFLGDEDRLLETMGLACESDAYDPMEQAMLAHCEEHGITRDHLFGGTLIEEYAFTNEQKMMGHVWRHDGMRIVAAKGSPEQLIALCGLSEEERKTAQQQAANMAAEGLRVIAVGERILPAETDVPDTLSDCTLTLCGIIGLADPPRDSVRYDIEACVRAGIRVVMITGDSAKTAQSIAEKIGLQHGGVLTGDDLDALTDDELCERVRHVNLFARVIPAHKTRIVQALKKNGEVVAMTGDGVNDAPALKYADIGIAMGKRGSEVAREAADLILLDDNFSTIVSTVRDGRRIYDNIQKAVGYVFIIHIPIALIALIAPMLGIPPESLLLLPLHVVLLELVIDPTCSIVLERQPAEQDIMLRAPRKPGEPLISMKSLGLRALQGLTLFAAAFGAYLTVLAQGGGATVARAMGLCVLLLANLFLVHVNSSRLQPAWRTAKQILRDPVMWAVHIGTLLGLALTLYTPLCGFLKLAPLSALQLLLSLLLAAASVLWFEVYKLFARKKHR